MVRLLMKFRFAALLTFILSLSSCIPAAIVVGATAGGAIIYDHRSMSTMVQDRDSAQIAMNRISASPQLQGTHIVVATFDHIMLLVGQTPTDEQRQTAYQLVSNIRNISRVYNEITVQNPTSTWRRSHDTWITTKLKTEMMAQSGLHSTQIKVVTEDGVVYLMGVLTQRQRDLAVSVARRADGVRKVVEVFENPQ